MNFDNCIYLCKDNPNKDIKNVYYSKKSFCGPFSQFSFPPAKTNFVLNFAKMYSFFFLGRGLCIMGIML